MVPFERALASSYNYALRSDFSSIFTCFRDIAAFVLQEVDDFGTNRKRIYDFLLVINSNYGPILHRFRDTAT